ncbi:MAG: DUF805 domain-containing protein [Puniceicoccales bacterium]|jgi:uncharacterized membrane protein YhaH (DUF805 family)|nr:DUF805 domain-containing protein [Puniceicoccales bacterium]
MKIFKLYWFSFKKSFTTRGRASRSEFVAFHLIGLIPIAICRIIALPAIHHITQQSQQLLAYAISNVTHILPTQSTKPETIQGIANALSNSPAITMFQQKLGAIADTLYQHLLPLLFLLMSILAYVTTSFSVTVRRLHDGNLSGYFYLVQLIPVIGVVIFLMLMFIKGTDSPNHYGPNPQQD